MSCSPAPEMASGPVELGCFVACLACPALAAGINFYGRLGFTTVGGDEQQGWVSFNNAGCELSLMAGLPGNCLNFRGADVSALAEIHRRRGLELLSYADYDPAHYPAAWHTDSAGQTLALAGAAGYLLLDPDGNHILFDSVPRERMVYLAGQRYCNTDVSGELLPGQKLLGWLHYCLNVADVRSSVDFYLRLGLQLVSDKTAQGWAVLGQDLPAYFRLALFQGHISTNLLNFRGAEIFALAERLAAAGLPLRRPAHIEHDGSASCELVDPMGNVIYCNSFPGEQP